MRIVKLYAVAVAAAFVAVGGYRLMFVDAGVPAHWPRPMRFKTSCLTSAAGLTQSFKVTADAIGGVTLLPAIAPGTSGELLFELRGGVASAGERGATTPLYKGAMPLSTLATDEPVTLKTPPVPRPADGSFTLWIGRSSDSGCLAFQASAVAAADAQLVVGDREVFGDLLFQVHADRGTALDGFQRWLARAMHIDAPPALLAALALVYAGAISVLSWMLTAGRASDRGRGPE